MKIKLFNIIFIVTFSLLLPLKSWSQTESRQNTLQLAENRNVCANFVEQKELRAAIDNAPPPVRTLDDINHNTYVISVSEEIFYKKLGLIPSKDGGYTCLATDPNNNRREFTIFKVKKVNNILVVSSFLDEAQFLPKQKQGTTDLFLAMIQFYTDIPQEYYSGIHDYFQEFYLRIANQRLKPNRDRVYAVDEPSNTVILYHPIEGNISGTAISLNIPLF